MRRESCQRQQTGLTKPYSVLIDNNSLQNTVPQLNSFFPSSSVGEAGSSKLGLVWQLGIKLLGTARCGADKSRHACTNSFQAEFMQDTLAECFTLKLRRRLTSRSSVAEVDRTNDGPREVAPLVPRRLLLSFVKELTSNVDLRHSMKT